MLPLSAHVSHAGSPTPGPLETILCVCYCCCCLLGLGWPGSGGPILNVRFVMVRRRYISNDHGCSHHPVASSVELTEKGPDAGSKRQLRLRGPAGVRSRRIVRPRPPDLAVAADV